MAAYLTDELRAELLRRWSQPHRRHHTPTHLQEVLDAIGDLADAGLRFDRQAVDLAAWFHDAVYEIGRDDNEERSAELAHRLLAHQPIRDEVGRLVLITKTHKVGPGDTNGAVLSDADLSVLGSDPKRYREYALAVRDEFAEVPDDTFRPARARILTALLHDGQIFHTEPGRARWEDRARANVSAEIEVLT